MSAPRIGDNGGPPLESDFNKKKWAQALFRHPKKPPGAIAMAFKLYMEMDARGRGAAVSDLEFASCCGVTDRSAREFKRWLVDNGFVYVTAKGARGRVSIFAARIPPWAEIPEAASANRHQIPEAISGSPEPNTGSHFRKSDHELPETSSGNQQIPEAASGSPTLPEARSGIPDASRARGLDNNITNKNNKLATVETEAARELAGLNGSQILFIEQLAKWINPMMPDRITAERTLQSQIQIFGAPIVKSAFSELMAQIDSGSLVARPIVVLSKICQRKEAEAKLGKSKKPFKPSRW